VHAFTSSDAKRGEALRLGARLLQLPRSEDQSWRNATAANIAPDRETGIHLGQTGNPAASE
jgi:hypothetical protein